MPVLVLLLGLLGTSVAARWTTPEVPAPAGLVCRVANEAARPATVQVEGLGAAGRVTFDSGPFRLAPGAVFQTGVGARARRCRFTLERAVELRAEALAFDPGTQVFAVHPAVPAPAAR